MLSDSAKVAGLVKEGQLAKVVEAYAKAVQKKDTDQGAQLREQIQESLADFMRKNDQPAKNIHGIKPGSGGKKATVFNAAAIGNRVEGEFSGVADFFQTIWHNRERTPDVMAKLDRVRNAFSSGDGSDGGFLVPETFRSELLSLSLEDSIVRSRATVIPMGSPRVILPAVDSTSNVSSVFGGVTTYWTEEAGELTASSAKFARISLDAHTLTAYTEVPNQLLSDGVAFEAFIQRAFPAALSFAEDDAFMNGNGVGQPLGYQNATAAVTVAKESGQAADTILWQNIVKMYARMLPGSLSRAVWVVPPSAFPELATMALSVGTGGSAIWLNNGQVGPPMTILGRPVVVTEKAPNLGEVGDIAFVDMAYYLVGDRQAMTAESSPHFKFQTNETAFKVISRVDGRLWLNSAITPKNNGDTLSPVVLLAARA
jgi:HK97 family phage major capsid protein